MAIEKKWPMVPPQLLTVDGGTEGEVQVANAAGFKVKQIVVLQAPSIDPMQVRVQRVVSKTLIIVGPAGPAVQGKQNMNTRVDVSAYTVALGSFIFAAEQDKVVLKPEDILQALYDQEPTVGLRSVLIDQFGDYFDSIVGIDGVRRLAVDATVTVPPVSVNLDAFTKVPADNAISVGTEDGTQTGIKHAMLVDDTGRVQTAGIQLFTKPFDSITASYPSSTQEIYQSRVGGVGGTIQQVATVNYTDATKNYLADVSVV